SVVSLCACIFCTAVLDWQVPIPFAAFIVLLVGAAVGFLNGFLVTYFGVQAFVVTLCGLFLYRGAARWVTNDQIPAIADSVELITRFFRGSILSVPVYLWLLLGLFAVATIFLHFTVYGRYFFAIGSNERAAAFSGINTRFYKIIAYMICSIF